MRIYLRVYKDISWFEQEIYVFNEMLPLARPIKGGQWAQPQGQNWTCVQCPVWFATIWSFLHILFPFSFLQFSTWANGSTSPAGSILGRAESKDGLRPESWDCSTGPGQFRLSMQRVDPRRLWPRLVLRELGLNRSIGRLYEQPWSICRILIFRENK